MHASVLSLASLVLFQLQVAPPESVRLEPPRPSAAAEPDPAAAARQPIATQWGAPVRKSANAPPTSRPATTFSGSPAASSAPTPRGNALRSAQPPATTVPPGTGRPSATPPPAVVFDGEIRPAAAEQSDDVAPSSPDEPSPAAEQLAETNEPPTPENPPFSQAATAGQGEAGELDAAAAPPRFAPIPGVRPEISTPDRWADRLNGGTRSETAAPREFAHDAAPVTENVDAPRPPRALPPASLGQGNDMTRPGEAIGSDFAAVSRVNFEADGAAASATLLVKHALTAPEAEDWRLPGQPLALYSALERATDRTSRMAMVRAYWRMTADAAAYYWSVEEGSFISGLEPSNRNADQALLASARLAAQSQLQQAKVTATAAQNDLADLARFATRDPAPLPRDVPLVSAYQTKFEKIFANRTPPAGLRRIALSIPLQLELVETQASLVGADTDLLKQLNQEYRQGQASLESIIVAHDRLHKHRQEFLQAVRLYNELIAEYALAIGGSTNNLTLVSMLIRNPATPQTSQAARRAPASAPNQGQYPPGQYPPGQYPANQPPPAQARGGYPNGGAPANSRSANGSSAAGAAPRTSSRSGTWMAPRTTVRDGSVRGSAAEGQQMPSFSDGPPAFQNAPRTFQEPAGESYPAESYPSQAPLDGADTRPVLGTPQPE